MDAERNQTKRKGHMRRGNKGNEMRREENIREERLGKKYMTET